MLDILCSAAFCLKLGIHFIFEFEIKSLKRKRKRKCKQKKKKKKEKSPLGPKPHADPPNRGAAPAQHQEVIANR